MLTLVPWICGWCVTGFLKELALPTLQSAAPSVGPGCLLKLVQELFHFVSLVKLAKALLSRKSGWFGVSPSTD